ncbi:hypothetical protein MRX96_052157 [Rhipicephalus microplus]
MDFVTQAMGDDFDGQAQITDGSGTKAKAMNVLNGLTQVKRDFAGKVQMQEDSDRQEQVTKDSARQAEYPEDTVGQTVSSADRSSFSGVGEPFPFWRHIPPPTMCFPQRLVPYGYYGCLSSPTRPPTTITTTWRFPNAMEWDPSRILASAYFASRRRSSASPSPGGRPAPRGRQFTEAQR